MTNLINKEELFKKFQSSLLKSLYERFLANYKEKVILIKTLLMNNAYKELGEVAHQFKNQFGYFCAHELYLYFNNMENFINSPPEKKYEEICVEIDSFLSKFLDEINDIMKEVFANKAGGQEENNARVREKEPEEKQKKSILIAEDDKISQMVLKMMLQNKFDVFLASTGDQALDLYKNELPDLVLMDINMPVLNGYEAIKRMRAESPHRAPILAVTALFLEEERETLKKAGFENVIVKPYIESDIFRCVEQYLAV